MAEKTFKILRLVHIVQKNARKRSVTIALTLLLIGLYAPVVIQPVRAVAFSIGDVFAAVSDGKVQHYNATGSLLETLDTELGYYTTGMGFDSAGNLYVTCYSAGTVCKFNNIGTRIGPFGSGYSSCPGSIVFDAAGNLYVGHAWVWGILKLNSTGNPIAKYYPPGYGTDLIDLAADQTTMFYTWYGATIVKRFDVGTNSSLPDFATVLPGSYANDLRILPDRSVLLANEELIVRLNGTGNVIQRYDVWGQNAWYSLTLDSDGTSFWAGDYVTNNFYKFDIESGRVLLGPINTGTTPEDTFWGLAVYGETRAARQPPHGPRASFTHSPEKPQVDDLVAFDASGSKPGWNGTHEMSVVSYAWDFETDGIIDAYGATVTYAFPAVGTYMVTLNVTDAQGSWDIETHIIKVVTVKTAIEDGVAWLVMQQNLDGSWGSRYPVAQTAFAVLKLEEHAVEWKYGYGLPSPFDPRYPYREQVEKGLNYIFAHTHIIDIGMQPAGDPDTNGNGKGVYFLSWEWDNYTVTYETGIAMMAIAGSRAPERVVDVTGCLVDGWTYRDVVQDSVDYLAFGQNDADWARGGWSYWENTCWWDEGLQRWWWWSDQSNTGWATFGLGFAESPAYKFMCTTPAFVKTELNIWINYIQNDLEGNTNHGGAGYSDPSQANILRTGHLLYMMALVGDTATTPRVQDAVAYLVHHWNDPNVYIGWKGAPSEVANYQAMFNVMKGLFTLSIHQIDGIDWQKEFEHVLKAQQLDDGSWPMTYWDVASDRILSTTWALLTLEKVAPPPITKVLNPTQGELGDVVHVTLNVQVAGGETATVVDTLPSEWNFIGGTFKLNGVSATPTVYITPSRRSGVIVCSLGVWTLEGMKVASKPPPQSEQISYTITTPGVHMLEFDAKVTKAYWENRTVTNSVVGTWYDALRNIVDQREATADFVIQAFEQLHKTVTGSLTIKEKTNVQWPVTFEVTNPFSYTMTSVVITDGFGAELEIDPPFPFSITHGTVSYTLHGMSKQVHLTWKIGELLPGETARLIILVSTDINPVTKQEYTTPGTYALNSGATLKFIDPEQNVQLSGVTAPINVTVLPAEDQ